MSPSLSFSLPTCNHANAPSQADLTFPEKEKHRSVAGSDVLYSSYPLLLITIVASSSSGSWHLSCAANGELTWNPINSSTAEILLDLLKERSKARICNDTINIPWAKGNGEFQTESRLHIQLEIKKKNPPCEGGEPRAQVAQRS